MALITICKSLFLTYSLRSGILDIANEDYKIKAPRPRNDVTIDTAFLQPPATGAQWKCRGRRTTLRSTENDRAALPRNAAPT